MVSEETKYAVIERIKELERKVEQSELDLKEELKLNDELYEEVGDVYREYQKYKSRYLFEKKLNSNIRKALICGGILFGAMFFGLGYLFGTKPDNKYQQIQQQMPQPQVVETKKEPEQKNKTEIEQILYDAFEKYK